MDIEKEAREIAYQAAINALEIKIDEADAHIREMMLAANALMNLIGMPPRYHIEEPSRSLPAGVDK